jgi:hypothetical protein
MKNFLRLYFDGFGNVNYGASGTPAGAPIGADNGTSVDGTGKVNLGTASKADPAANLINDRFINFVGNLLHFIGTGNNQIFFDPDGASIAIYNDTFPPEIISIFNGTSSFRIFSAAPGQWGIDLGNSDPNTTIIYDIATRTFSFGDIVQAASGFASPSRTQAAGAGVISVSDSVILCDTSGGNITFSATPANLANKYGTMKKLGTDVNTITITPTAGNIYGGSGAAASFAFGDPGESISWYCDGTNIYII